jgi:tetratricopeptide (TPR) repeat protein
MARLKIRRFLAWALAGTACWLIAGPFAGAARSPSQAGQPSSDPVATAVDDFYNLQFDAAQKGLDAWLEAHPNDLRALSYQARVSLQREMLRRELLEAQAYGRGGEAFRPANSPANAQLRQKIFAFLDRLDTAAQTRLKRNPGDEDALYWIGASHVTRAIYFLTLEKSSLQALGEAKEAQKYNTRLLRLDPDCTDAYLVIGTYDYVVGSLPWYTKVLAALIGYRGDRARGLEELKRAADHGHWARTDAQTLLSILDFREKRYADAIGILENLKQAYPRNFVVPQEIARARKAQGDWRFAAQEYDDLIQKYESGAPGFTQIPAAKIYYQAGQVYAHLGETEDALHHFLKAAALPDGDLFVYRAELAAAAIEMKQNYSAEARSRYERVARAVPNTGEGRAAAQALKSLASNAGSR